MIRLTDPARIGPALRDVRDMLGIGRTHAARLIAQSTGRTETSVKAQLWTWDVGGEPGYKGCRPDLSSLGPYLDMLEMDLALIERVDPDAPRTWPRLDSPPDDVKRVRCASGTVWTRMEKGGHYWMAKGWENGVSWAQVLRWGPVTEMREE